jgi:predicted ArsR family transcriptional regulator
MEEVRPVGGRGLQGAGRDLSEEEREALREEMRAQREGSMLDEINEVISGDEVTEEELQELRDLREDLGLLGNQNRRGGGVGGQGTGECPNL